MPSLSAKLFGAVIALALVVPAQADTVRKKHRKIAGVHAVAQQPTKYRGTDKFRAGPIYDGRTYLGDDPDPFIRGQLARDVNAIYGGND